MSSSSMSLLSTVRHLSVRRSWATISTVSNSHSIRSFHSSFFHGSQQSLSAITTNNINSSTVVIPIPIKNGHTIRELPPNLKFDPRAISRPLRKQVPVAQKLQNPNNKKDEPLLDSSLTEVSVSTVYQEPSETEQQQQLKEEEEEEERVLDNLAELQHSPFASRLAIPLPQRLHVSILDLVTAQPIGTLFLSAATFGCDPIRIDILHRCVVYQRNKKRGKRNAGARTKTIHEVSGSGRKVRQQKGSGKARAGHSRPAHWRGGAKAHGPKGRITDYTTKLNKKVRKMGVRQALSQKLKEGNLIVVAELKLETHKTKKLEEILGRFNVAGKEGAKALIIDDAGQEEREDVYAGLNINLKVASGNLYKVKVMNQLGCNVYDILKFEKLILSLSAIKALEERLKRK